MGDAAILEFKAVAGSVRETGAATKEVMATTMKLGKILASSFPSSTNPRRFPQSE